MPRLILVLAGLVLSALADAQSPQLRLPAFTHLRSRATQSVDISLGSLPFRIAGGLMDGSDPESADMKSILKGLHALYVRHYEFDSDFVYPMADIDAVRTQLGGAGWSPIAHVRDRKRNQDVDVYLALENDKITGLAIVASEPREFTIVNAVGSLDLRQVDTLRRHFELHRDAASNTREPSHL